MLNHAVIPGQYDLVVVDDDDLVHERIKRNVRHAPWSVTSFLDPEESLIALRHCAMPDLLLVDNRMPRMDGLDLIDLLPWPVSTMSERVYLWSGIDPPADIHDRAGQRGVKILLKDALFESKAFMSFLANMECHEAAAV